MSTSQVTTILSIDPGYDRVGWAVGKMNSNNYELVTCECIQTNRSSNIFSRYKEIVAILEEIQQKFTPTEAAIETLFFSKNRKTAMRVSEARGIIISSLLRHNIEIFEYNPGEIKQAVTGYGNANKRAVAKMVRMQTNLKTGKLLDDAIDAVAVGMTHAVTAGMRRTKTALEEATKT